MTPAHAQWLLLVFVLTLTGCTSFQPKTPADWIGYTDTGEASFYANKHEQRKTASGERYRHALKTAAHREMPFGLTVKVTNTDNGKSVVVKINDRGPFVRGRIIDLSRSAFSSIGNPAQGVIPVRIEVIR